MKNILPFLVAAAPGAVIFACMRSMSRERRSAEGEVEKLIAELGQVLSRHSARAGTDVPRRSTDEIALSERGSRPPSSSSADLSSPPTPNEEGGNAP